MMEHLAGTSIGGRSTGEFLQRVLNSLGAEIAILDRNGTILAVNRSWKEFAKANGLGWADYGIGHNYISVCERAEGRYSEGAKEVGEGLKELIGGTRDRLRSEYPCPTPTQEKWFIMDATSFIIDGSPIVVVVHEEITGRKRAEREVELTTRKLKLLGSITRHDILNQLSVVMGYVGLLQETVRDEKGRRFLEKVMTASETIQKQLDFQRDYERLHSQSPQWMKLEDIIRSAFDAFDLGNIRLLIDTKGLTILCDPLMEKVFYNLINNSMVHGQRVTEIRVYFDEKEGRIIYEDNGTGIPSEDKEKIFERGFGKDTGLGLHLVREVLSGDGMSIVETGGPGNGARFEIALPRGLFTLG